MTAAVVNLNETTEKDLPKRSTSQVENMRNMSDTLTKIQLDLDEQLSANQN